MNRRGFLASLLAAATLDSERLLWVPGRKTISVPSPRQRDRYNFGETFKVSHMAAADAADFHAQFILPAVERVNARMAQAASEMMVKIRVMKLELPSDMRYAKHLPGDMRFMLASDVETAQLIGRVDALVEM